MSLRTKFLRNIFPPSLLGILITAIVSITFLLGFYLNIVDDARHQILEKEYTSIKSISDSLSLSVQEYFLLKLSYMEEIINYSETLLEEKKVTNFSLEGNVLVNAYDIATDQVNIATDPEYDPMHYLTTSFGMWYLNPNLTNLSSLPEETLNRLYFASQLDLELRAVYEAVIGLTNIYMVFIDDGLQYLYPASKRLRYVNYSSETACPYSVTGKSTFYDLRCTSQMLFGYDFLNYGYVNTTLFVSKTFILMEYGLEGVIICGVHYKNLTEANFTEIPQNEREIDYLICGEFLLSAVKSVFDIAASTHNGYSYVLDQVGNVIYHPAFRNANFHNDSGVRSITEYEFLVDDEMNNTLAAEYNSSILPLIQGTYQEEDSITRFHNRLIMLSYEKSDGNYIGTLSPIFFPLPKSNITYHGANLIYVISSESVMQPFVNLKQSIYRMIIVQSIGVAVVIVLLSWLGFRLINYVVNSIITPLSDLHEVVMKMLDDDLDTDVTRNYTPQSEEITQLYQSFSKLKFVMKYANAEFFSGNDAQALINYSNALKLYEEINNQDGIGMTYNNIGNIHLKNKRYEEAIVFYRKAVLIIENDLNAYYKDRSFFRDEIKFKENKSNPNNKKPLYTRSRRNYKAHKMQENPPLDESTLNKMNELYCNRLFQLGLTLYTQHFQNNHEENLEEIIDIFEKVIQIDTHLQTNPARTIQSLIFISNCYLAQENHLASLKYLNEAESSVFLYETAQKMLEIDPEMTKKLKEKEDKELTNDIDYLSIQSSKFNIKSDILKQLWMYHSALFCKTIGKLKQACILYTKTLETGKIYDPLIRKKCLEDLSFILASQGLLSKAPNITTILSRLDSFKGKEIVFLLDVSESMGEGARLKYAIRNFVKIFDRYLRGEDKVAFLRFNYLCEVVFNLTPKKNNTIQLRRQIEGTSITRGGTAFYDALDVAISEFDYLRKTSAEDGQNTHWIVALTDGEDNLSRVSLESIKRKLRSKGINLIIIGLGLGAEMVGVLSELCKATKDGVFIETPNNDDLDIAFEAISEVIYGTNFIVETFSFS